MKRFLSLMLVALNVTSPLAYGQSNIVMTGRGPALETYVPQIVAGSNYLTVLTYEKAKKTSADIQVGYDWGSASSNQALVVGRVVVSADQPIPSGPFGNELKMYGAVSNISSLNVGDVAVDVLTSPNGALV